MKINQILLITLFLISCSSNNPKIRNIAIKNSLITDNKNQFENNNIGFQKVHSLKKNNGDFIGDVYVHFIKDDVFTELIIVNKMDTLYLIKKNILSNTKGKDIEVFNEGFYGYKFVLKKSDYIVLTYLRNFGANISDDIKIEWNYKDNNLEVQKIP